MKAIFESLANIARAMLAFGVAAALLTGPSHPAEGEELFKGQTVRITVGYSAGAGYDAYARMLAPHFAKKLDATVIVENLPGGAGLNALNSLVSEKPTGLRMMLVNAEGAFLAQLIDQPGMRFDISTLRFLGRVSYENRVLLASAGSPFSKIDAFIKPKQPVYFGASGKIDGMGDTASILCQAMAMPCKVITGYKGSADVTLALVRNEVHAQITSESQSAHQVRGGKINAVAVLGPNKAALLPSVPTIFDLVQLSPKQSKWIRFRAGISDIGRAFVVPPGTPKQRADILEKVIHDTLTDKEVQAQADKTNRPISYAPPDHIDKVIKQLFASLSPQERKEIKDLLLTGY
jgi:tripartite-type tricarboxylate transporter receptor subunit TctC